MKRPRVPEDLAERVQRQEPLVPFERLVRAILEEWCQRRESEAPAEDDA